MKFDDIISELGEFGRYQKLVLALVCQPCFLTGAIIMGSFFFLTEPPHRCSIPGYPNDTYRVTSGQHSHLIDQAIPRTGEDHAYSPCALFEDFNISANNVTYFSDELGGSNRSSECGEWVFDQSEFQSSIITEYQLVCENTPMRSHTNMGMFLVGFISTFVSGVVGDILGRKVALVGLLAITTTSSIGLYFFTKDLAVILLRSIQGASLALFALCSTTSMELIGVSQRSKASVLIDLSWVVGELMVLVLAYICREWRVMQLVLGLYGFILTIAVFWLVPESPRWLLGKGRLDEAEAILQNLAARNKTVLPPGAISHDSTETGPQLSVWEMFKHKNMCIRCLIILLNWFSVALLYYGMAMNLDNLFGNMYVNFAVSLIVEGIAYCVMLYFVNRIGRTRLNTSWMIAGGLACLSIVFPVVFGSTGQKWIITALAMLGKLFISGCFAALYLMTSELLPTVVRSSTFSVCVNFENMGGMISPYIADLGKIVGGPMADALPMIVFGSFALVAGLCSLRLPETLNRPLPDTIQDAIDFGRKVKPEKRKWIEINEKEASKDLLK